jgi:hypothetical protein
LNLNDIILIALIIESFIIILTIIAGEAYRKMITQCMEEMRKHYEDTTNHNGQFTIEVNREIYTMLMQLRYHYQYMLENLCNYMFGIVTKMWLATLVLYITVLVFPLVL